MGENWVKSFKNMAKSIKNNIDVSVITVAYNSENEMPQWAESVVASCKKYSCEMIVTDNSPTRKCEAVIKKLQKKYPNLLYKYNDANLGFSRGNNVGIKMSSGSYVLFLNPDMVVEKGTIDGMIDFLKSHPEAGSATPAVFLHDGTLDDSCHRGFPTPWRALCHFSGLSRFFPKSKIFAGYNLTYLDFSKTHEIDALAGSFLLLKRELGESLKLWDEDYFFYGEDIDFCYRIIQKGLKIYYVPEFKALHHKGISSGIKKVSKNQSKATREVRLWATNHRFRAMEIFYNKHYKKKYPFLLTGLVLIAIKIKKQIAIRTI